MNENTNHTNLFGEVAGNDLIEGIHISHQPLRKGSGCVGVRRGLAPVCILEKANANAKTKQNNNKKQTNNTVNKLKARCFWEG